MNIYEVLFYIGYTENHITVMAHDFDEVYAYIDSLAANCDELDTVDIAYIKYIGDSTL